jgi:hypothetical protein
VNGVCHVDDAAHRQEEGKTNEEGGSDRYRQIAAEICLSWNGRVHGRIF